LLISKIIPPTSIVVPLISKYLLFTFIMNILSVLNTCIVIGFYFKELKLSLMPPWFRYLFLKLLPTILFIRRQRTMEKFYAKKELTSILNEIKYDPPSPASPGPEPLTPSELSAGGVVKKRLATEYVSAFSSPMIRSTTMVRLPSQRDQYEATLTAKAKTKGGYEHVLNRKANSQHDLVLTQDAYGSNAGRSRVVTSTLKQTILNNPSHYDDNDAIIENYLREKLTQKKRKKLQAVPKNALYDMDKLNRSPEIRQRFQHTNLSGKRTVQIGSGVRAGLNLNLSNDYDNLAKRTSTPRCEFASMSGAQSMEANLNKKADAGAAQPKKRRVIGFETFQFSERFAKLVRSVDYIANIYKAKAEIDDVRKTFFALYFNLNLRPT
jgi:hypothetical protein